MTQELLLSLLEQAKEMKSQLDALRPLSPDMEKRISDKLRLDWNYHSNHIEGNSLTYGETKMLLMYGITSNGKPLKDAIEMKGHNEALKWVLDIVYDEYPLSETFIRELNKMLLGDPYEVDAITPEGIPTKRGIIPGEYKSAPNHVQTKTGEIFRFAEPFETPAKMHDLIDWFRTEGQNPNLDPILFAIEFHYRFIRIHPFDDGNGRTVRILMNFILMQYGYPPAIIRTDMKEGYLAALEQADTGDLGAFFEYVTREVIRSLDIMLRGARGEEIDDEDDDVDKQMILLKKNLEIRDENNGKPEKEKYKYIIDEVIMPFLEEFSNEMETFDIFFESKTIRVIIHNNDPRGNTPNEVYALIRSKFELPVIEVTRFIQFLEFGIEWNQFKHDGYEVGDLRIGFNCNFYQDMYKLFDKEKLYSQKLTVNEKKIIISHFKKQAAEYIKSFTEIH